MINEVAIFKHHRGVELGSIKKHIELAVKTIRIMKIMEILRQKQRGKEVIARDSQSVNPGFKSRSNE